MGADIKKINLEISRITGLNVKAIKKLIKQIAKDSYIDVKPFYDYRHITQISFEKNKEVQKIVNAIANVTADTYVNLSNSQATGFLIRDLSNPGKLKFQPIGDTYRTVIDEAIQASQSGVIDYRTAMRRTLRQLSESGVRKLYWDSGYTQRLDTAVKRNILDGIHAINQAMQDEVGKEFGADGKEITVHANSALDHEPIQGHQFTNEEFEKLQSVEPFEDVNGNKFDAIERAIGIWNCRHYTYSIIVGFSKPRYTQAQLDENIARNHKGYTTKDGKHFTMYECTQIQRKMETRIRELKDGQIMSRHAGDDILAKEYQAKINAQMSKYRAFSKACGLPIMKLNIAVSGYHKIGTK